jgi:peroxin-6
MDKRGDWSRLPPIKVLHSNGVSHRPSGARAVLDFRRGEVVGDRALSYNLGASPLESDVIRVSIAASPFGPQPPPLPAARSVTVAQISSPPSSNDPHGRPLLWGLRNYFRATSRVVKRGDVLIVPIETDSLTIHINTTLRDIPHIPDGDL